LVRSLTLSRIGWFHVTAVIIESDQATSSRNRPKEAGLAIAIGSLLDGVPESVVLGLGLLAGQGVSTAMLAAIFLSNLPEGLSSALGMKRAGRSKAYVFGDLQ